MPGTITLTTSGGSLDWTIPDTPLALSNINEGTETTFDLMQYVNVPSDVSPAFTITSQTKGGVAGSYGITVNSMTGLMTVPNSVLADNYSVTVALAEVVATAEADWLARSTASGVLWSHAFTNPDEVDRYRWAGGIGNSPDNDQGRVTFIADAGLGYGGAVRCLRPQGNTGATTSWIRQFSPMQAWRSLPADPGIAAYPSTPAFNPVQNNDISTYWRHGFYAPPSIQASKPDTTYHGDEFWLSFRIRISGSRATAIANPLMAQKIWYVTDVTGSVNYFNLIWDVAGNGDFVHAYTGATSRYPDTSSGRLRSPQFGPETTTPIMTEPPYNACTIYAGGPACWLFPFDEWVTFLIHVKTGVKSTAGDPATPWKGPSDGVLEVAIWQPGMPNWQYLFRDSQWSYMWGYQNFDPEGYGSFLATTYIQTTQVGSYYTEFAQMIFSQQPIAAPTV